MRKKVVFLSVIVVFFGALFFFIFMATNPLPESAEKFFALIRQNKVEEAYQTTAKDFQRVTPYEQFFKVIDQSGVGQYKSTTWYSRSISNNTGQLQGTIVLTDKSALPTQMEFVQEQGVWKILNLQFKPIGPTPETAYTPNNPPHEAALQTLTGETMKVFTTAVATGKFDDFYASISTIWQKQTTPADLALAFQDLANQKAELFFLADQTVTWDLEPYIDEQGMLKLEGHYTHQEKTISVLLSYTYEHPDWKLFGININIK